MMVKKQLINLIHYNMVEISKETVEQIIKRVDENVAEIKIQTIKTNGRVTDLEDWQSEQKGALKIIKLILVPIILAVIISFII